MHDLTRAARAANWSELAQSQARSERLTADERVEVQLANLQDFIHQLQKTQQGLADLRSRERRLGPCRRGAEEPAREYYGRLRRWIDFDCREEPRSGSGN